MTIKRRAVLQTMLMSPFFFGISKSLAFAESYTDYYNFFIHGLFFMELKTQNGKPVLEIKAPKISGHTLLGGARKNLREIQDVDFTKIMPDLPYGTPNLVRGNPIPTQVKRSILQFSKDETGVGQLKPFSSTLYHGRIILPWPDEFYSLRADDFPYDSSNVAYKMKARCGGNKIGTLTCLQFPYKIPGSYHIHLLACEEENVCHVNHALVEARSVFDNPAKFDLGIAYGMADTPIDNNPPVTGAIPEDENSAKEDEPNWAKKWCSNVSGSGIICPENINPANCPHFFVG